MQLLRSSLDTDQGSWPSPINRNWLEARQGIQARLYWGPCCSSQEWKQGTVSLSWSWRGIGVRPGVQPEGGLGGFPTPLVVLGVRGMPSTLLLLPVLQKWQVGFFWSFCILLSIICPNCQCMQLFLVPYCFFVFCFSRRCLSRCKHCGKGSRVSGPSLSHAVVEKRKRRLHSPWDCEPTLCTLQQGHSVGEAGRG